MKEALLAAVRDPEGEDAHGFDPALIFRRYLVTTPSEQQQAGLVAPLEGLGLGLDPAGGAAPTRHEEPSERLMGTVEAEGWPAVRAGRNDGRVELDTLSSAELEEVIARHEGGVGPAIIPTRTLTLTRTRTRT